MSKAVVHNGVVYLSGQTSPNSGDTAAAQTAGCLAKVDELLAEAGTDKSRALQVCAPTRTLRRRQQGRSSRAADDQIKSGPLPRRRRSGSRTSARTSSR